MGSLVTSNAPQRARTISSAARDLQIDTRARTRARLARIGRSEVIACAVRSPRAQEPPMLQTRSRRRLLSLAAFVVSATVALAAQQMALETRDLAQPQDEEFARLVKEWTTQPSFISPLVDHLPKVPGVPSPKDTLGYHVGAPGKI